VRCAVGDKYVNEEMMREACRRWRAVRHVIFSDYLFTGDGLCTALNVIRTIVETGRTLAELASDLVSYPQCCSTSGREKKDLASVPAVARRSHASNRSSTVRARAIRYSGTEPLLRAHARRPEPGRHPRLGTGQSLTSSSRSSVDESAPGLPASGSSQTARSLRSEL